MPNTLRAIRLKVLAVVAAPLLLGSTTAAAPPALAAPRAEAADSQVVFKATYYADASYSQAVGEGYGDCDGNIVYMEWGYQTSYVITLHFFPCAN